MADPGRHDRLQHRLTDLAEVIEWPPAPDLRASVQAGIRRARQRRARLLLLAAALAAAVLGGAVAATFFELRGASIQPVPRLPSVPSPSGGTTGERLGLGERYATLQEAERAAGFRALVPSALGQPDEAYWRPPHGSDEVGVLTLVYRPRPGLPAGSDPEVGALVMEARADLGGNVFVKYQGPGTSVRSVTVNRSTGYWVSGVPHGILIVEGGGIDHVRLAGNVLLWDQGGLIVRIESSLDEQQALRVAGTVR
jgi:hypothetical protein